MSSATPDPAQGAAPATPAVKRYVPTSSHGGMTECISGGEWVRSSDLDALIDEHARLQSERDRLRAALTEIVNKSEAHRLMLVADEDKGRSIHQGSHDRWEGMHGMAEIANAALRLASGGGGK